jgi:hypothetical protein
MTKSISKCRICGNDNLVSVLNLGEQALTGVFPKSKHDKVTLGPLELVKCHKKDSTQNVCGLLQLKHTYDFDEIYGLNYGYRSGLNQSMVAHLKAIVQKIESQVPLKEGDLIIDIGSNDSTLLSSYNSNAGYKLIGIDPTGVKFKKYYPSHVTLIPDFFSSTVLKKHSAKKAKVITSISMFYDLEAPMDFMKQIHEIIADDGIWVFEQSYLPLMLSTNSYDTVCHEHLEYYGFKQVQWMAERIGFKIIDVELNDVNGGSFRVTVSKSSSSLVVNNKAINKLLEEENALGLDTLEPFKKFVERINDQKQNIQKLIRQINEKGQKVFGYGASTKGNVLLQYCGFTSKEIPFIAEVNEDKFGSFTPFSYIPIISEIEARKMKPDYFLVLPWHFRKGILKKEQEYINSGGKFIFPLPNIELYGND